VHLHWRFCVSYGFRYQVLGHRGALFSSPKQNDALEYRSGVLFPFLTKSSPFFPLAFLTYPSDHEVARLSFLPYFPPFMLPVEMANRKLRRRPLLRLLLW